MMRPVVLALAAPALVHAATAQAQGWVESRFASVATYSLSIPTGDTRQFLSTPSLMGVAWEAHWVARATTTAVSIGVHDFYDRSGGTTDFDQGSATGEQLRDLLVATVMANGRWFPAGIAGRGPYVNLGVGALFMQQSYQLGVMPQLIRSAIHLAVAPEIGAVHRLFDGVDAVASARYMLPTASGRYLGGGTRRPQFLTINLGIAEHF
jgi:hypothetical protein